MNKEQWVQILLESRNDPVFFCEKVLKQNLWSKQKEILRAVWSNRRVAVRSSNSVGKSYLSALAAITFLQVFPDSIVVTTAPSFRQVKKPIWEYIKKIWKEGLANGVPLKGKVLDTGIQVEPGWYAIGFATDSPDRFQGQHASHVLFIADEASGVDEAIWKIKTSILTGPDPHELIIGNPRHCSGYFFDTFYDKDVSSLYEKFHISAFDSPNFTNPMHGVKGWKNLADETWVDEQRQLLGEGSPFWMSNVLGEFPFSSDDVIIKKEWVDQCIESYMIVDEDYTSCWMGVDVARFGSDRTVFVVGRGNKVDVIRDWQGKRTTEVTSTILSLAKEHGVSHCAIDDTGVGGGVSDQLITANPSFQLMSINFSNKANDHDKYGNIITEMWFRMAKRFEMQSICIPNHPRLCSELASRKYEFRNGKIVLESKDKVKLRGLNSPDFADALALAIRAAETGSWSTRYSKILEAQYYRDMNERKIGKYGMAARS